MLIWPSNGSIHRLCLCTILRIELLGTIRCDRLPVPWPDDQCIGFQNCIIGSDAARMNGKRRRSNLSCSAAFPFFPCHIHRSASPADIVDKKNSPLPDSFGGTNIPFRLFVDHFLVMTGREFVGEEIEPECRAQENRWNDSPFRYPGHNVWLPVLPDLHRQVFQKASQTIPVNIFDIRVMVAIGIQSQMSRDIVRLYQVSCRYRAGRLLAVKIGD